MTLTERRQREKAQRREDILNAAEKLFFSRSYDDVSMDEIASKVELNKATLYLYFKDKESLYFAVVNRGIKILRAMVAEEAKNAQASGLKAGGISMACSKFIQEYPDYLRACNYIQSGKFDFSNSKDMNSDAREIIEFIEELYEKSLSAIKNYIEDGTYRPDLNPVVVLILNSIIADGLLNISPFQRKFMETHGITVQQLYLGISDLVIYMTMNTGEKSKDIHARTLKWMGDRYATDQNKS
ncbi:TetR/AcrR family transcriptional regulator [Methanosarcina acetivorans]|uniref:Transcriptional regulator, TetR family n=1 Tax=Methanosarcina acetivorans (strain ATCC 35395 / DSM 2834 / JCM 12185 / C2A) TaxID=188937 RepID=Q8TMA0_METAC|nr:TetR/AcrR family transcriptional regulator [Methanosarcina acetivorans]AAM06144.1 transcriptional regulator, TetR family [Methanosarcina acetivorans C2A]